MDIYIYIYIYIYIHTCIYVPFTSLWMYPLECRYASACNVSLNMYFMLLKAFVNFVRDFKQLIYRYVLQAPNSFNRQNLS